MCEPGVWWIVMRKMAWTSLTLEGAIPAALAQPSEGCVGFIPVFDTQEAAIAWAEDGETVMPVREAK